MTSELPVTERCPLKVTGSPCTGQREQIYGSKRNLSWQNIKGKTQFTFVTVWRPSTRASISSVRPFSPGEMCLHFVLSRFRPATHPVYFSSTTQENLLLCLETLRRLWTDGLKPATHIHCCNQLSPDLATLTLTRSNALSPSVVLPHTQTHCTHWVAITWGWTYMGAMRQRILRKFTSSMTSTRRCSATIMCLCHICYHIGSDRSCFTRHTCHIWPCESRRACVRCSRSAKFIWKEQDGFPVSEETCVLGQRHHVSLFEYELVPSLITSMFEK